MPDLKKALTEDRRLVILRLLRESTSLSANDRMLQIGLAAIGHNVTLDVVRADLAWLADVNALKFEVLSSEVYVATLLRAGQDHVDRLHVIPGIKRPSASAG